MKVKGVRINMLQTGCSLLVIGLWSLVIMS